MAFIADVAPNDVISSSSWGNPIRDQVITTIATTASLSGITSPADGQHVYIQDIGQIVYHNGTSWVPGAGQVLARGSRGSSSSTTTSEVGVLRFAFAIKANILYTVRTLPLVLNSTQADDYVFGRVRYTTDGSTPSTSSTILTTVVGRTGFAQTAIPLVSLISSGTDVTLGLLLTVGRAAGTGTVGLLANSSNPYIDLWLESNQKDPGDIGVDV